MSSDKFKFLFSLFEVDVINFKVSFLHVDAYDWHKRCTLVRWPNKVTVLCKAGCALKQFQFTRVFLIYVFAIRAKVEPKELTT